jgi:hypothetical protein
MALEMLRRPSSSEHLGYCEESSVYRILFEFPLVLT